MTAHRIEEERVFICPACHAARRATLTGLGRGRSETAAAQSAKASLEEVVVFLRCPACGARLNGSVAPYVARLTTGPLAVLTLLAIPAVVVLVRAADPAGRTVGLVYLGFLGLVTAALIALVTYNLRRAQNTQVRWH